MTRGKQTCRILKEIRRQIAEANDIEFVTSECRYKGDCRGTCPKCEAEVRYLEQQLRHRQLTGKAVMLAGLSAGMIAISGCGTSTTRQSEKDSNALQGEPMIELTTDSLTEMEEDVIEEKEGELTPISDSTPEPDKNIIIIKDLAIVGEVIDEDDPAWHPVDTIKKEYKSGGVYTFGDPMPVFPGGKEAMNKFINEHLVLPDTEIPEGNKGKVVVQFIVDSLGLISSPRICLGEDTLLQEEALRIVSLFPPFIPGKVNGKKASIWFTVAIPFNQPTE